MVERTCANCGRELPPRARLYCKDETCVKARKAAYMREFYRLRGLTASCTEPECDRPLRANGLCSTHFNRTRAKASWHRKVTMQCHYCGVDVQKAPNQATRYRAVFCSFKCRSQWQRYQKTQQLLPVPHADPWSVWGWCDLPPREVSAETRPRFFAGQCPRCGDHFIADRLACENGTNRYCSSRCARSAAKERRRARKVSAYVADVYRHRVFDRDGWRCQICRRKVSRTAKTPNARAATLDHIIPLALGGTHEPTNCQTACFECNARKSHLGVGDQLRLIA